MNMIDEKGRIFGKINFVDFLVILFLIGLTPIFYFGNKALSRKEVLKVYDVVPVKIKFTSIMPELANALHEGDIIKDDNGVMVGVLQKIISNVPSEYITINQSALSNNGYFLVQNPNGRDVLCVFKLKCTEVNGVLYFSSYPVKIGTNLTVNSDNYSIQGTVISFDHKNFTAGNNE